MRRCPCGSEGIVVYGLYPGRRAGAGDAVSCGAGRSYSGGSCVPCDRCVRGSAGDVRAWLRAVGSGGDGAAGLRSARSSEAVSVWLSAYDSPQAMRLRRSTVEHPFAALKYRIFGHPRLLLRGTRGAEIEIGLATMAYNLQRIFNLLGGATLTQKLNPA